MTTLADMVQSLFRMKERASAPSAPAAGYGYIYIKDDKKFYIKNSDDSEVCISETLSNPMTDAGDMIVGGTAGVSTKLAGGDEGDVLTFTSGAPAWSPPATIDYILIQDQKAQNTSSGTFTSGAWQTRVLNTEVADTGGFASVASNQITLAAGTYVVHARCPAYLTDTHQAKLYNVTDTADICFGSPARSQNNMVENSESFINGYFTLAAQKVLEVRHYCERTSNTDGFGIKGNFGTEVFASVEFWKVA